LTARKRVKKVKRRVPAGTASGASPGEGLAASQGDEVSSWRELGRERCRPDAPADAPLPPSQAPRAVVDVAADRLLRLSDVQALVLAVLADGANPRWATFTVKK
jgi:hypothetical protein